MHAAQQHSAETARMHYQIDVRLFSTIYLIIILNTMFLVAYGRESAAS